MSISAHQPATTLEPAPPELAEILAAINRLEIDGATELATLHERHPRCPEILGHLSHALARKGRFAESLAACERLLTLCPDDLEAHLIRADRLVKLGRLEEAERGYRRVADSSPDDMRSEAGVRHIRHLRRLSEGDAGGSGPVSRPDLSDLQKNNRDLNRDEMRAGQRRLRSLPPELYLESTTKCNFACRTCAKGYGSYHAEDLHESILERVRSELLPTATEISITGFGEPTLAANFDEILEMTISNGSVAHFVTNASPLGIDRIDRLVQSRVSVTISIDGATRSTFESIRTGGNFQRTLERLAMIQRLRSIHADRPHSMWHIHFVALRSNIDELCDVIRLAKRFGIDGVTVLDYEYGWREFDEESLRREPAKANRVLREAEQLAQNLGIRLDLPPQYDECNTESDCPMSLWQRIRKIGRLLPERRRLARRCPNPWSTPYITTDGTVTPCCSSDIWLGSIMQLPFAKIWNGWRYRLLRWRIHSVMPPLDCRHCSQWYGINGGNAGNVIAKEGLIIKVLYRVEILAKRAARALARRTAWIRGSKRAEPVLNYHRGRPVSANNRPPEQA